MNIIRNFADPNGSHCLLLNSLREVNVTSLRSFPYYRGFYIKLGGNNLTGIFASTEGPLFFFNQDLYLLEKGYCTFDLKRIGQEPVVHFIWREKSILQIPHAWPLVIQKCGKTGNYTADFFCWLSEAVTSEKFYSFYTLKNDIKAIKPNLFNFKCSKKLLIFV
ncbi:hypothetical protein M3231_16295 [Neobacillus mesonae]|nr:hypothetical protein [Neobacillus mesonae]